MKFRYFGKLLGRFGEVVTTRGSTVFEMQTAQKDTGTQEIK